MSQRKVNTTLFYPGIAAGAAIFLMIVFYFLYLGTEVQKQEEEAIVQGPEEAVVNDLLDEAEEVWRRIFSQNILHYERPSKAFYNRISVVSCGREVQIAAPSYCRLDQKMYLDPSFVFQFPGEGEALSRFYLVGHLYGHHIQRLLRIHRTIDGLNSRTDERGRRRLLLKRELEADCLAGVWAKRSSRFRGGLEKNEIRKAIVAVRNAGTNLVELGQGGEMLSDTFRHGKASQVISAFLRGYSKGNPQHCLNSYSFH